MKITVTIIPLNVPFQSKVTFYSVLLPDAEKHELQEFTDRFKNTEYDEALKEIRVLIANMGTHHGAQERFFRKEDKSHALPSNLYRRPLLRLYCLRCCDQVVIFGNGGVKESNSTQGSPDCYPHFLLMNAIAIAFRKMKMSCCDLPQRRSPFPLSIELDD